MTAWYYCNRVRRPGTVSHLYGCLWRLDVIGIDSVLLEEGGEMLGM